ncbi:MAG: peptidoglycan-binding domain-containing protein [Elainella sp.]
MEIVAYLEGSQNYEQPQSLESISDLISEPLKRSGKAIATGLGIAATAWTGGLFTAAPALACGSSCGSRPVFVDPCCRPRPIAVNPCCRPRPIAVDPCCRPRPVYYHPVSSGCYSSCQSKPEYYSYDYHDKGDYYEDDYSHDYDEVAYYPEDSNLLKIGSSGQLVALLQQTLADLGYHVGVDGVFGYETKAAVKAYQADQGLIVDGIAGGQTLDSLGLAGAGA